MAKKKHAGAKPRASKAAASQLNTEVGGRFFISYAHGSPDDETLARWLHEQLSAAGGTVFLDERMRLGTNWKDQIPKSIADSDVFIVLISENSVNSDMVHEEVLIAREHHRTRGRPAFAPVRVRYSGELGYLLGAHLRGYQWTNWQSTPDSSRLLNEILAMKESANGAAAMPAAPAVVPVPPIVQLESIVAPGGAMAYDNPLYVQRDADGQVLARVRRSGGETLVLLGARQTGKSSLLTQCSARCNEYEKPVAAVDFSLFDERKFATLNDLLRELAKTFLRELRLSATVPEISGPSDMTWFIEDNVIQKVHGPVVLVIDEVDKVFEKPYRTDFFGMIRGWHNARAKPRSLWKQVDIVLAISTEPHLLMVDRYQSPFNVSSPIRLKWFDVERTRILNDRYGAPLAAENVERLHEFLGGHPYLTQLAFYELAQRNPVNLMRFMLDATDHDSAFAPHLHTLLSHLNEAPDRRFIAGFQEIVRYGKSPSDDITYRLQAAGLVRRHEDRVVPANELYARFFGGLNV